MTKMGSRVFLYYMSYQSLIYGLLSLEPLGIHYFSSLFSHVIEGELKTQLYYQLAAIFVLGYLTMISSSIILVLDMCKYTKNDRSFYYCYRVLLFVHSITFIYSISISIMSIYNLAYIQTDEFTELLKEKFDHSPNGIQIYLQCCGFMNATIEPMISAFASLIKSIGCVAIASFFIELGFFLTVIYSWFSSDYDSLDSADPPKNDDNANTECIIIEINLK